MKMNPSVFSLFVQIIWAGENTAITQVRTKQNLSEVVLVWLYVNLWDLREKVI